MITTLGWLLRKGFWTPDHLVQALRYLWVRLRHPEVQFEGFCFLGRRVELHVDPEKGKLIIGRWVHLADGVRLRAHEGVLRVGDKAVLGHDLVANCWLDIEIGPATIIGDRVYICDFDHVTADPRVPIKDQGLVKSPVRIGADCWLGSHVVVVRGTDLGDGSVAAASAVVRGKIPPRSIVAGVPGKVVAQRDERFADQAELRHYVDALGAEASERVRRAMRGEKDCGGVDAEVTGG
ncbi:acyltransferase [Propionibacteriaceae bacterium Y1700]|uniref:acyltransferase n=1 Tax=Microlunatus sp. Y1700 TaxID=3418487 RepID=UPI003DA75EF6